MIQETWNDSVHIERCKAAIAAGDLSKAAPLAREFALIRPASTEAYNLLGNVTVRSGDIPQAGKWFEFAVRSDDTNSVSPRLNHAMTLEMSGDLGAAIESYKTLAGDFPMEQKVWGKLARAQFQIGDLSECLEALASVNQLTFDQYYMRGRCRLDQRQPAKAVADFREALNLRPSYPEAYRSLGESLAQIGRHEEALTILEPLAEQDASDADLNYTLGRIHFDLGNLERARDCLRNSLSQEKTLFHANRHLGIINRRLGAHDQAIEHLKVAVEINHNDYLAFDNLGELLADLDRKEELKTVASTVLDKDPANPSVWNAGGIFLKSAEEASLSISYLKIATAKFPDQPVLSFNLAHMMNESTFAEEAEPYAKRALLLKPDYAKAWNALCVAHCMPYNHAEARVAVDRALMIDPTLSSAWLNIGVLERSATRFTHAIKAMRRAIEINPADTTAQTNLAYALLMAGELDSGFRQYDQRWHNPGFPSARRPFALKIWQGESLPHHGLLVYMEQGMGDEIMFSWYMRYIAQRAAHVLIECDYRLVTLFQRSFPTFEVVARRAPVDPATVAGNRKYKSPAGHIPKHFWFETREHMMRMWPIATRPIARTTGYLTVDPARLAHWRDYLDSFGPERLKVGICWRSSYHNRARDLQYLAPEEIGQCFDENFVVLNLQYDYQEEEIETLTKVGDERGYQFVTPPEIDLKDDLDDLTALCEACDIIVTPLISTAFMAGAVGTPTWVFRAADSGRIWQQLGSPFVPWFPSMRLFFRYPTNSWAETIDHMRVALRDVTQMDPSAYKTVIDVEPEVGPPDWKKSKLG